MNNTSYKDPSGYIFKHDNLFYRKINKCFKEHWECFINSGLYAELTEKGYLISHEEIEPDGDLSYIKDENFYKLILPKQIKFITYPYEWCFSALKDSALLTLKILKTALKYSMILKDGTAYNIQFFEGKPIFIDTLSFEKYVEGKPWVAYKQFCQHFLAPLALMSYSDTSLNKLLISNIDGIPLSLASKLLPASTKFNPLLLMHIHLHSKAQNKYENSNINKETHKLSKNALFALIDSLEDAIKSLKLPKLKTEWGEYYSFTNYNSKNFNQKKEVVSKFIEKINPKTLCDLGANNGEFSRLASERNVNTLAFDIDIMAVEKNYANVLKNKEKNLLPLVQDLTNLSPAIGFANEERAAFVERFRCDTVMALALIHHLAISNNLPFKNIAKFFSLLAPNLIIEFVPKTDSKVQILLSSREDIFSEYDKENFEKDFGVYYEILEAKKLDESDRILYLMRCK